MGSAKDVNGGKSYNYFGTIAGAVCAGPVDALIAVIVDGKELWPGGKIWYAGATITAGQIWKFNHISFVALSDHTASTANQPGNATYWTEYTFPRGSNPYDDITISGRGVMRLYWGTQGQTVDPKLQSTGNNYSEEHPDYKGVCYIEPIDFLFGQETSTAPNIEIVVRRAPVQSVITGAPTALIDGQANLAVVIAELLTSPNGLGLSPLLLDPVSFQATAEAMDLKPELYRCSPFIDSQESSQAIFDKVRELADTYVRFNPSTKLIEMGIYPHGVAPTSYTTITTDDLAEIPKLKSPGWTDVKNRAVVQFCDRAYNYNQVSDKADDPRAFRVLGTVRQQSLDRPWITRKDQAVLHGLETLRTVGRPPMTGEIAVRREKARTIRAGDYILLNIELEPGGPAVYQFCRVEQRTIPSSGPIRLSIVADNTLAPIPWHETTVQNFVQSDDLQQIGNMRFIVDDYGISDTPGSVIVLAERPNMMTVGWETFFDVDSAGSFVSLGQAKNFAAKATLYADLAAFDSSFYLTAFSSTIDTSRFEMSPGSVGMQNDELLAIVVAMDGSNVAEDSIGRGIVEIISIGEQTLISPGNYHVTSCLRGRFKTTPRAFTAGSSEVWLIPRSLLSTVVHGYFPNLRSNRIAGTTPATAYFRLTPFTKDAILELADTTTSAFRFTLKAPEGPTCTIGTSATWTDQGPVTHKRLAHTATTIGYAAISPKDLFIGYFAVYLVPQGGQLNLNTPACWFNILTGQSYPAGLMGSLGWGSLSTGVPVAYLGIGTNATITTPGDATCFPKVPITIPSAGNYRLLVLGKDVQMLASTVLAQMDITAT